MHLPTMKRGGGAIALHKLCHNLNEIGRSAFLLPLTKPRHAIARRAFHCCRFQMQVSFGVTLLTSRVVSISIRSLKTFSCF